jgi:site-specific recombinase XerD
MEENTLAVVSQKFSTDMAVVGLDASTTQAILAWAASSSDQTSSRFKDLVNDKSRIVGDFLCFTNKRPDLVIPADVQAYQIELEKRNLAPASVYGSLSRISAFYTWMLSSPDLAAHIFRNPVDLVRPKAPKPYQTESAKSLTDTEATALLNHVRALAQSGDLTAKRDYAMLLIYF